MTETIMLRYWWGREMRPTVLFRRFLVFLGCAFCLQCILNLIEGEPCGSRSFAHSAYYTPWLVVPVAAWFALRRIGATLSTDEISVTPAPARELCLWAILPFCCSLLVAYEGSVIVYWAVHLTRNLEVARQLGSEPYYFAVQHNLQAALSIFLLPFVLSALILMAKNLLPGVAVMIGFELVMLACTIDAYSPELDIVDFYVMNRLLLIAGLCSAGWFISRFRQGLSIEFVPDQGATRARIVWISCGLLFALLSFKVFYSMSLENGRICRMNLWNVYVQKELYVSEFRASKGAATKMTDLVSSSVLSSSQQAQQCPSGGIYAINAVGIDPTCTIPGHILSRVNEIDGTAEQSAHESTSEVAEMQIGPGGIFEYMRTLTEPELRHIWRLLWRPEW